MSSNPKKIVQFKASISEADRERILKNMKPGETNGSYILKAVEVYETYKFLVPRWFSLGIDFIQNSIQKNEG